jgi:hypothetical protein
MHLPVDLQASLLDVLGLGGVMPWLVEYGEIVVLTAAFLYLLGWAIEQLVRRHR